MDSSRDMAIMVGGQRQNMSGFKEMGTECRKWSDLPLDVLNIIAARLEFVDQIYFRVVCKNWRKFQIFRPYKKLPWLLGHHWAFDENVYSVCSFYCPSADRSHVTYSKIEREEFKVLHGAAICASKFGWLLLQKSSSSFFYNPYTKSIIKLPDIDLSFNRTTFSSVPTSPDCFCFTIQSSKNDDKIHLRVCHPGDRKWSTLILDGLKRAIEDVVYINETFFCLFSGGVLGAFRVVDRHWSFLTNGELISRVPLFQPRAHMVESKGELLLVRPVCPSKCFEVFKFDWLAKTWLKITTLGCQALFLGCTSFSVSAEGDTLDFAERIYDHGDIYSYYYLMKTEQSSRCTFYPWYTKRETERVWIQPPEI